MNARLVVLYNNKAPANSPFKSSNGLSWYLEFEDQHILFDLGLKGSTLLHNMEQIGISPDDIDILVLSHAHIDHTGALPDFLKARTTAKKLLVIAHPSVLEPKRAARLLNIGLPDLDLELKQRVRLQMTDAPYAINPFVFTTGEISDRSEKDGTGWVMQHLFDGHWSTDPILDDQSIVLSTKKGLIVICGCCHAGLINTCNHVKNMVHSRIIHVLGGTHTRSFSRDQMEYIGDKLELELELPNLSLGHCVGRKQLQYLKDRFGTKLVGELEVGDEFTFELSVPDPMVMQEIWRIQNHPASD